MRLSSWWRTSSATSRIIPAAHSPTGRPASAKSCNRILTAAVEVDKAIFFSVIITIAAFLPLFTMQGVEGQIFGPMARTYAYALIGSVIATFTITPVLASVLLPEQVEEVETFLVRWHPHGLPEHSAARGQKCAGRRDDRCGVPDDRPACSARGSAPNSCPSSRKATCGSGL